MGDLSKRMPCHPGPSPTGGPGLKKTTLALVAGAGYFGARACRVLQASRPHWRLLVVDLELTRLGPLASGNTEVRQADALELLEEIMDRGSAKWIVPAVPFHLAHAWIMRTLSRHRAVKKAELPQGLPVPNPLMGPTGDLYTSYATFRCPEHCTEPKQTCSVTGLPRPAPLYDVICSLKVPGYEVAGLRSRQLGPGVGGILAKDMLSLRGKVMEKPGRWILYTACRCHGVLSGLEVMA